MSDASLKTKTLPEWEAYLAPQARQVELLAEIPIGQGDCRQLGQLLGGRLRSLGPTDMDRTVRLHYPCAFAVYLVAQGSFGYQAGDYWSQVCQLTGLNRANTSRWGQLFEEILATLRLPLFPDLGGRRYVDLILMHGGIPTYSLADFFENMLRPAVTRDVYAGLSAEELIDDWLLRAGGRFVTDKPVLRFLEFGGQIARDFVERCRELAREFLAGGLVASPEEIGLPRRVVEKFYTWAVEENRLDPAGLIGDDGSGLRLRRPEIWLDPSGRSINLELPPQQIPATFSQARLEWTVQADGQLLAEVTPGLQWAGYDLRTTPESLLLNRPAALYEVTLWLDGQPCRTWRYQGPDADRPWLVFEAERGSLLRRNPSLPAQSLWLLYPAGTTLQPEGPAAKLEECPPLPGGWTGFRGEAWDLREASRVCLYRGEQPVFSLPVRVDETGRRPHLVGGSLFFASGQGTGTPLYVGAPPSVRIPLVGRTGLAEELSRWRLFLQNHWAASPERKLGLSLADLQPLLQQRNGTVELPLAAPELLGDRPAGSYVVRLRGPLGRDAELPLRIVPQLYVTGHEELYLPDPQTGPPEIRLLVETGLDNQVECREESAPCRVECLEQQTGRRLYELVAPPDSVEASFTLVAGPPGADQAIRVPVRVGLRRVQWALSHDQDQADAPRPAWSGRPIRQPFDALDQAAAPALFIHLPEPSPVRQPELARLRLRLVDLDNRELQSQEITASGGGRDQGIRRIDLPAYLDTIRHTASPAVRFELVTDSSWSLPVLSLTRSMIVENVALEMWEEGPATAVKVTWQEPVRLRHRRLRFWSLWRPWQPYYEETIPDEADGELCFKLLDPGFLFGCNRLEFLVVDPWSPPDAPTRPPGEAPNTATIATVQPEERLKQLERAVRIHDPQIHFFLEQAYIKFQTGGDPRDDLSRCEQWFDRATIPQVLALAGLVRQMGDQALLTRLQLKMFAAGPVQRLLAERTAGSIHPADFKAYLANLPRHSLLPLPACSLLLAVPDEKIQLAALMRLLEQGQEAGLAHVLARVKDNRLSDADAVHLLGLQPLQAAAYLKDRPDDPAAVRLLLRLSEQNPQLAASTPIVRPGYWVRSAGGWGRIERIEDLNTGRGLPYFNRGQTGLRLKLTLRPQHDAAPAILEILPDRQRLIFQNVPRLYRCTKGRQCAFITRDQELLVGSHNRLAHGGLSPQFIIEHKLEFLSIMPAEFQIRAPREMLG